MLKYSFVLQYRRCVKNINVKNISVKNIRVKKFSI